MKEGRLSDHIIGCSCMHGTKGHHSTFNWIDISTHDRLDLGNEVRGRYKSIIGLMWKGRMPSLPVKVILTSQVPAKGYPYWSQCLPPSNQGAHADHKIHRGASRQKHCPYMSIPPASFSSAGWKRKSRLFFGCT